MAALNIHHENDGKMLWGDFKYSGTWQHVCGELKTQDTYIGYSGHFCWSQDIHTSAETIIQLFDYSVGITLFDSFTHYSNNH